MKFRFVREFLIDALLVVTLVSIALLTWQALRVGWVVEAELRQLGDRAERQIQEQGDRTRELLQRIAFDLAGKTERQVAAARKDLRAEASEFCAAADRRLGLIQEDAREQFAQFRQDAERQLSRANDSVSRLAVYGDLKPQIERIVAEFAKTSSLMFDCDASPRTCVAPRFAGTFRSVELAAGDFSKAMKLAPRLVGTAQQTNEHIERYVDRFTKPRSTGAWIRDIGLTAAGLGWRVMAP